MLMIAAVLLVLWVLAIRYGYDSRDGICSKEQELAAYGVSWRDLAAPAS